MGDAGRCFVARTRRQAEEVIGEAEEKAGEPAHLRRRAVQRRTDRLTDDAVQAGDVDVVRSGLTDDQPHRRPASPMTGGADRPAAQIDRRH